MKLSRCTITLIAAFGGAMFAASAQAYDTASMQQGLDMLKTEVSHAFVTYQIDADPETLSLAQIAIIVSALNSSDNTEIEKKDAIKAALRNEFNQ